MSADFDGEFQLELLEANSALGMALSEIGRAAGLPPGASSCEIEFRVVALVQEIAELKCEHGLLSGELHELRSRSGDEQ